MTDRYRVRPSSFYVALTLVVIAGFALRVWGNRFGLPFLYHEDEAEIVQRALRMPVDGPGPGWFRYPTLYLYVQAVVYVIVWGAERVLGSAREYAAFADAVSVDPTIVYTAGRTVTAAFGAATIAAAGIAARRFASFGPRSRDLAGLAAASLVCIELLQVGHSHFITADIPMTFVAVAALGAAGWCASSREAGSVTAYAVAGALVGIAASIKYPAALSAVGVVAVYVQQVDWRSGAVVRRLTRDLRLPAAGVSALVAFVLGSPYVILDWRTFLRDLGAEAAHMRAGHLGFEIVQNHWAEVLANFAESGNLALVVLAVAGAVTAFRARDVFGRALAVTLAVWFAAAVTSNVFFARYCIPMLPIAAVLGAHAITTASLWPRSRAASEAVACAGLVLALALPSWLVAHRLALFTAADTRTQARTWVDENLGETGALVALEWKSIPRRPAGFDVAETTPLVYDAGTLRNAGVSYVAITDRLYRRLLRAPGIYPSQYAFYKELLATGTLVATFTPYADEHNLLVADEYGAPSVLKVREAAPWSDLVRRERSGPVILVFRIAG